MDNKEKMSIQGIRSKDSKHVQPTVQRMRKKNFNKHYYLIATKKKNLHGGKKKTQKKKMMMLMIMKKKTKNIYTKKGKVKS